MTYPEKCPVCNQRVFDIVDGMQSFPTEFNATQYVVAMMLEKGIVLKW